MSPAYPASPPQNRRRSPPTGSGRAGPAAVSGYNDGTCLWVRGTLDDNGQRHGQQFPPRRNCWPGRVPLRPFSLETLERGVSFYETLIREL